MKPRELTIILKAKKEAGTGTDKIDGKSVACDTWVKLNRLVPIWGEGEPLQCLHVLYFLTWAGCVLQFTIFTDQQNQGKALWRMNNDPSPDGLRSQ